MQKIYIQSQFQSIFNRIYLSFIQFFWMVIPLILIPLFMDKPFKDLSVSIYSILIGIISVTVWLMVFNSGKSKLIGHGISFDEQGVNYTNYGSNKTIKWDDFNGLTIKNKLPRLVVLSSLNKNNIEFSYYTFSSEQRKEIFEFLYLK